MTEENPRVEPQRIFLESDGLLHYFQGIAQPNLVGIVYDYFYLPDLGFCLAIGDYKNGKSFYGFPVKIPLSRIDNDEEGFVKEVAKSFYGKYVIVDSIITQNNNVFKLREFNSIIVI